MPAARRLGDLENTLGLMGLDPEDYAPLLAPILDIALPAGRASTLAPEELRRRQLAAIVAWLLAGARSQPIALAFEDLHWAGSDLARSHASLRRARGASAALHHRGDAARVPPALEPALPPQRDLPRRRASKRSSFPGGHIGLFMGSRTPKETWPLIARWIVAATPA
ncbi:MAG: hypothetical protein JO288_03430 [Hyphomicrobiales bacterium]|nr:hypothetical protein [Hyphomicrobiales bacterium]